MKQEILTLEHGVLADALVSLKESSRKISRFMQEYRPLLDGDRYLTDKEVAGLLKVPVAPCRKCAMTGHCRSC